MTNSRLFKNCDFFLIVAPPIDCRYMYLFVSIIFVLEKKLHRHVSTMLQIYFYVMLSILFNLVHFLFQHFVIPFCLGLFQKKIPGGGRRQAIYFSMGGRCAHFSNYMGPWCLTNSDYIGGGVRPISNSVGGCIAFAASRRRKNIICKSPCCALFVFRDALPFCQLECPLSVSFTYADLCLLPWGIYACVSIKCNNHHRDESSSEPLCTVNYYVITA